MIHWPVNCTRFYRDAIRLMISLRWLTWSVVHFHRPSHSNRPAESAAHRLIGRPGVAGRGPHRRVREQPGIKRGFFVFQLQRMIRLATLAGFATTLSIGCGEGTEVQLQPAPPVQAPPPQPVPKAVKQGRGPQFVGAHAGEPGCQQLTNQAPPRRVGRHPRHAPTIRLTNGSGFFVLSASKISKVHEVLVQTAILGSSRALNVPKAWETRALAVSRLLHPSSEGCGRIWRSLLLCETFSHHRVIKGHQEHRHEE